jgi:hypothetical protein
MAGGKLFVVSFELQQEQVKAWCLGKGCGKGIMGAIDIGVYGSGIPCRQADCPYLDREMDQPMGIVAGPCSTGGPVYLRKLRDLPKEAS